MACTSDPERPRRRRVERGIYLQPNGKYAVCCRHAGRLRFRTAGRDLDQARRARTALIAAVRRGEVPVSPRLRFGTVVGWWLDRFAAKVAAGERHPRTLEAHRYHVEQQLLPRLATRRIAAINADDVAKLLLTLRRQGCSAKTTASHLRRCTASCAMPAATDESRTTRSTNSSPTSVLASCDVVNASSAVTRSSGCSLHAGHVTA